MGSSRPQSLQVCYPPLAAPPERQFDAFRRLVERFNTKPEKGCECSGFLRNLLRATAFTEICLNPEDVMVEKTLNDLFYDTLKDINFAERQILKTLPKLAKAAKSEELKTAFLTHRDETERHVDRLQKVFEMIGKRAQTKTCEAIKGILEEGDEIMDEYAGSEALDAGLLASGQAVEHYEMSRYGTLKAWATQLGMRDVAALLDQTLQEEKKTDALLSKLAQAKVNLKAA